MKQRIVYPDYVNRVHGCWLGKCIAGAIGASYGRQHPPADVHFRPAMLGNFFPNADFDLQVLWLDMLEEKGIHIAAEDIVSYAAEQFPEKHGISPLAFELWACVAPGDPALASKLAALGATPDTSGALFQARQFLAAVGARAFVEPDLDLCLDTALEALPGESPLRRLVQDTRAWCGTMSEEETRDRVARDYGHLDRDNHFRDIAFAVLALHYGESEFFHTVRIALQCGDEPASFCSTAGALLGIHHAATGLMNRYDCVDQPCTLGVKAHRPPDQLCTLAEAVARVGIAFAAFNNSVKIMGGPHASKHA